MKCVFLTAILAVGLAATMAEMGTPLLYNCQRGVNSKLDSLEMEVSDCDDPNQCDLIRNTTHTVVFTFVPSVDTAGLKMMVFGQVLRVRVPYVRNVDLCKTTVDEDGVSCAGTGLKAGKTYIATYQFHIRARFPPWHVPVEFELWDGSKKLSCTQVKVKIQCNQKQESERTCKRT